MLGLALMMTAGSAAAANRDLPVPRFRDAVVHDPSVIRAEDGTWYIFGSHMAAARSSDLIQWTMISSDAGAGCTLVENVQEQMKEALTYARTNASILGLWPQMKSHRLGRWMFTVAGQTGGRLPQA